MARWRVAVRIPDGPPVPILLRGAETVFAATGEGTPREVVADMADAIDRARIAYDKATSEGRDRLRVDAGAMFGRPRRPAEQRIYTATTRDALDDLLDRIAAGEAGRSHR